MSDSVPYFRQKLTNQIARFGPFVLAFAFFGQCCVLVRQSGDLLGRTALWIYFCSPVFLLVAICVAWVWRRVETERRETTYTGLALFGSLLGFSLLSFVAIVVIVFMFALGFAGIGPPAIE